MDWTAEKVREATKTLDWLYDVVGDEPFDARWPMNAEVRDALADDLNTSAALHALIRQAQHIRPAHHPDADGNDQAAAAELKRSADLLGLLTLSGSAWRHLKSSGIDLSQLASRLEHLRISAKASKDFSAVDTLKSALVAAGVEVRMTAKGVELVPGADFDAAKFEAL